MRRPGFALAIATVAILAAAGLLGWGTWYEPDAGRQQLFAQFDPEVGDVLYSEHHSAIIVRLQGLPMLDDGQVYQTWRERDGAATLLGDLGRAPAGAIALNGDLRPGDTVVLTAGAPGETGEPRAKARLQ